MRTQQVECIVFKKDTDDFKFLLLKRIPSKGHFWQPPCGGVEKEDTNLTDAVLREIKEEAGISEDNILRILYKVHSFTMNSDYLSNKSIPIITEYVFGIEVEPETKIDITKNIYTEHEEFKWVNFQDALELLKWEDNKTALKKLHQMLSL